MLDALAVELRELLVVQPQTEAQLLDALADVIGPLDRAAALEYLQAHLGRLKSIGLLRELSD